MSLAEEFPNMFKESSSRFFEKEYDDHIAQRIQALAGLAMVITGCLVTAHGLGLFGDTNRLDGPT